MDSQFDKGLVTRKQVMGEDFVAKAFGGATDARQHLLRCALGGGGVSHGSRGG